MSDFLKALFLGVVQGVTEWLPVSSTGHMLLFDRYCPLTVSPEFRDLFLVVIQLFSVLAVVLLYRKRLFSPLFKDVEERKRTLRLWGNVIIGVLPAAVCGVLFDDMIERYFYGVEVVAVALIFYGIVFLLIERKKKQGIYLSAEEIDSRTAFHIGLFQILSLIPGTSRSGATVIGGLRCGCDRETATEFSFYLSIPVMLGASSLRTVKYLLSGDRLTASEWQLLLGGGICAFLVSCVTVRFLTDFVKRHSFRAFGVYRILLGIAVILAYVL